MAEEKLKAEEARAANNDDTSTGFQRNLKTASEMRAEAKDTEPEPSTKPSTGFSRATMGGEKKGKELKILCIGALILRSFKMNLCIYRER